MDIPPAARFPRAAGLLLLGALGTMALAASPIELTISGLPAERSPAPAAAEEPSDPLEELDTTVDVEDWERLADCESGDWDADGEPEPGSAAWDYGTDDDHGDHFQGGLNFHPDTWDAFRGSDMPAHAGRADPVEEIEVAERVLDEQGWEAWPVCSDVMDLDE